jgi:two-component system KDP operon response regulator KdpE
MANILIIDDDAAHGDMASQRLRRAGHDVSVHVGPFGATVAASKPSIDLIVLDVFMPALPGPDLLELLRKNWQCRAAILLCSSMDPGPLAELAREYGADGHVSKSAGRDEFIRAVEATLQRRASKKPAP